MTCTNPITIPIYRQLEKTKGFGIYSPSLYIKKMALDGIPSIDVPCGKCIACRIQRTNEWVTRIMHEFEEAKHVGCFITLTYRPERLKYANNEGLSGNQSNVPDRGSVLFSTLRKCDLQKFFKRLRKKLDPLRIKHFSCGEYGDNTNRPHYHSIILHWAPPLDDIYYNPVLRQMSSRTLDEIWPDGHNVVGALERDSVQYTVGYIRKKLYGEKAEELFDKTGRERPFQLQSQGIGLEYAEKNIVKLMKGEITVNGKKEMVPRYYKKKLKDFEIDQINKDNIVNKIYEITEQAVINNLIYNKQITRDRQNNEIKNAARAKMQKEKKL